MMQVTSHLVVRRGLLGVGVAVMIALAGAAVTQASSLMNHPNIIRFSAPVALPGHVLPAGAYVFEIANPSDSHDVVRVLNKQTHQPLYVGFTRRVERPATMSSEQAIALDESATGTPRPVRAWYPIGFSEGHEFIYK